MPLTDLRQYIEALRGLGEIQQIDVPVSLDLELGAITRRCYETGAPAPLFTAFSDHSAGFRILGAPAGTSRQAGLYLARVAVSLGLPPGSSGLRSPRPSPRVSTCRRCRRSSSMTRPASRT